MLAYHKHEGVALITLNRPDVFNAFDDALGERALAAVADAAADGDVRCIVVTGAGRAFCAGEDLGALANTYRAGGAAELGDILRRRYNPLVRSLRAAPKPVVAAVNGVAAGAGMSLALACDFRIASEDARFTPAFATVGLVPDSGMMWFLANSVGRSRALELVSSGRSISAAEALALGLVTRTAPAAGFEDSWRSFARELAGGPTAAFALTKALADAAPAATLDEALEAETQAQTEAGRTADHNEGVAAWLDRRTPRFEGR